MFSCFYSNAKIQIAIKAFLFVYWFFVCGKNIIADIGKK